MPDKQQFTVKDILLRLENHLIGADGNGGVISDLKNADQRNRDYIDDRHRENQAAIGLLSKEIADTNRRLDKIMWLGLGAFFAVEFLTGTGWASLDHILRAWPFLFK